jgi:hypothetical protein
MYYVYAIGVLYIFLKNIYAMFHLNGLKIASVSRRR